eukprot:PhM_4_TR18780/c0_g2_i2/m.21472
MNTLPNSLKYAILDFLPPGAVEAAPNGTTHVPLRQPTTTSTSSSRPSATRHPIHPETDLLRSLVLNDGLMVWDDALDGEHARLAAQEASSYFEDYGDTRFKDGGVGSGGLKRVEVSTRGDKITFLDSAQPPEGIGAVVNTIRAHLKDVEYTRLSIQLAVYPGDGVGYATHRDVWPDDDSDRYHEKRRLTFLYFLNSDWVPQHGGRLSVFPDVGGRADIAPKLNTMVCFSSALRHTVCPPYARRMALAVWVYSTKPFLCSYHSAVPERHLPRYVCPYNRDIFVSVADYCDPDVANTISSLFTNAYDARRVYVGVVHQISDPTTIDWRLEDRLPDPNLVNNIRRVVLPHTEAKGPCYARALCQSLYAGEKFYLQIDAHMRFRKHWDRDLITWLLGSGGSGCWGAGTVPVLSTYPPDLPPDDVDGVSSCTALFETQLPTRLVASHFEDIKRNEDEDDDIQTSSSSTPHTLSNLRIKGTTMLCRSGDTPVPCSFVAAGFLFTFGRVVWDVPYDASLHYVFFGEEARTGG